MNTRHFVSRFGIIALLVILVLVFTTGSAGAASMGTAFTYQGQLTLGGSPVTGSCNFRFGLWDALTGGSQIGSSLTQTGVTVTNGFFTVQLDFGTSAFMGEARWLEIAVGCGTTSYTTLTPRQPLTPAPYALYALAAGNATTVTNGVYTTGGYANPSWLTALAGSKITGAVGSATNFIGALAGDVTGTQGSTLVTKLQGVSVDSTTPTNGQVLQYNGTRWTPTSFSSGGVTSVTASAPLQSSGGATPNISFTGILPIAHGGTGSATQNFVDLSSTQTIGGNKTFSNTITGSISGNAASVTNGVYTTGSYSNPAWITSLAGIKITGAVVSATSATNFSGSLVGDVTGTQGATNVTALRGVSIVSTAPTTGQVLQYNGTKWAPASALAAFWNLTGNSSTVAGTNFLGTLDNVALEFKVNNSRALRLEPNATSPNILGGYKGNSVTAGVVGAVISGGGYAGDLNRVTDDYGVVGGGIVNQAGDNTGTTSDHPYATVSGGQNNTASGYAATVGGGGNQSSTGLYSTIGGGYQNTASGVGSIVGGGNLNNASNNYVMIGGGLNNTASANESTVGGGAYNTASGDDSFVGGGRVNIASGAYTTIGGGFTNTASNDDSTINGGESNAASGMYSTIGGGYTNAASDDYATVGGGNGNTASGLDSTVGGGYQNTASWTTATVGGGQSNTASGESATVGGGLHNNASGYKSTIGGGSFNTASGEGAVIGGGGYDGSTYNGNTAVADASTIGGGLGNHIDTGCVYSTIGGGEINSVQGVFATVGGGGANTASGYNSTVGGGIQNTASGYQSTVGGGEHNTASAEDSFVAGGSRAAATHYGEMAHASGNISAFGDAQASEYVLRNTTTDATQTELFLDGSGQRLTLASNRTLSFDILIVAHSDGGDSAGYEFKGLIENVGGATNFVGGIPSATILGEDVPAWDVVVRANDTYDALLIKVTGVAGTNIRWVATIRTVEVGW